jgi:VanZ family protein
MGNTIVSTPNPEIQTLVYTVIRAVATILGTFGVTWGATVSGEQWQMIAGAVAVLISVGMSVYQKFQAARADHVNSVASATVGAPVKVVTPGESG